MTSGKCLPVDLKLTEIMSLVSSSFPCSSPDFSPQPLLPIYNLLLTAGGNVGYLCELNSHQDNHFLNCDDEDNIVSVLYSLQ